MSKIFRKILRVFLFIEHEKSRKLKLKLHSMALFASLLSVCDARFVKIKRESILKLSLFKAICP